MGNGCTSTRSVAVVTVDTTDGGMMSPETTYDYCKQLVMSGMLEHQVLVHAVLNQEVDTVKGILARGEVDLGNGETSTPDLLPPLVYATMVGNRDISELLIEDGADPCVYVLNSKVCGIPKHDFGDIFGKDGLQYNKTSSTSSRQSVAQSTTTSHSWVSSTPATTKIETDDAQKSTSNAPNGNSSELTTKHDLTEPRSGLQINTLQVYEQGGSHIAHPRSPLEEAVYDPPQASSHKMATERDKMTGHDKYKTLKKELPEQDDWQPMHVAAFYNHVGLLDMYVNVCGVGVDVWTRLNKHTPLQIAVSSGNVEAVQYLIQCGAAVNYADINGETALYKACHSGHPRIVDVLMRCNAKIEVMPGFLQSLLGTITVPAELTVSTRDTYKIQALYVLMNNLAQNHTDNPSLDMTKATSNRKCEKSKSRIDTNADMFKDDFFQSGNNSKTKADKLEKDQKKSLINANGQTDVNNNNIIGMFTEDLYSDSNHGVKWNLAHFAVGFGNYKLLELLVKLGVDPCVTSSEGYTLAHLTAAIGNVKMLRFLVTSMEADVYHLDNRNRSVLGVAAVYGRNKVIDYLHTVAGQQLFKIGNNPLRECVFMSELTDLQKCHVIHKLAQVYGEIITDRNAIGNENHNKVNKSQDEAEAATETIVDKGNNDQDNKSHYASQIPKQTTQEDTLLLHEQKNNNQEDSTLHEAVLTQAPVVIAELVRAGFHINTRDNFGNTILHLLTTTPPSYYSQIDICFTLLDLGVDLSLKNTHGHTALTLALSLKLRTLIHLFHAAGSNIDQTSKNEILKVFRFKTIMKTQKSAATYLEKTSFTDWLIKWYFNPQKLAYLCRRSIRERLHHDEMKLQVLCLTKPLVRYIMLKDIHSMFLNYGNLAVSNHKDESL